MSQYLNIFIKSLKDKEKETIIPIASFSRSSELYDIFYEILCTPFEKVRVLKSEDINKLINEANHRIKELEEENNKDKEVMERLKTSVKPDVYDNFIEKVNEKIQNISERNSEIMNYREILGTLEFLSNILFWYDDYAEILYGIEAWFEEDGSLLKESEK